MHAKWIGFITKFTMVQKHMSGQENKVANTFNWRASAIVTMRVEITSFELLKDL